MADHRVTMREAGQTTDIINTRFLKESSVENMRSIRLLRKRL